MHKNKVTTWVTDFTLDESYESLREEQYSKTHRLSKNYSKHHVSEISAKSIYYGSDGQPKIVCSILHRPCWPDGVYRILNRLWKPDMNTGPTFGIDEGFGELIKSQAAWCFENGAKGVFMSRETKPHWQSWAQPIFVEQTGIEFYAPTQKFLTCNNECDDSCWQYILYYGDNSLLNTWKQRV
jgi:hypothetical protein